VRLHGRFKHAKIARWRHCNVMSLKNAESELYADKTFMGI